MTMCSFGFSTLMLIYIYICTCNSFVEQHYMLYNVNFCKMRYINKEPFNGEILDSDTVQCIIDNYTLSELKLFFVILQIKRYARACSSDACFFVRGMCLSSKIPGQGYAKKRLQSSCRKYSP